MMKSDLDERLIQRVIDNECSVEERHQLMKHLDDCPDGWKVLACGFLEDQLFGSAAASPSRVPVLVRPTEPKPIAKSGWLSHPTTTKVLAACVMFLLGVVVSRQWVSPDLSGDSPTNMVSNKPDYDDSDFIEDAPTSMYASARPHLMVQAGDQEPQKVDVLDNPLEFISAVERLRQQGQQLRSKVSPGAESRIRYLSHVTDDGQLILVPVDEIRIEQHFQ